MLVECDLLIIDDLGTEFHSQFSVSQLYNIFNSRMFVKQARNYKYKSDNKRFAGELY